MALDLGVDILALCAQGQQLHQVDVVLKGAAVVRAVALRTHQVDQVHERSPVVVEQQNLFSRTNQLHEKNNA